MGKSIWGSYEPGGIPIKNLQLRVVQNHNFQPEKPVIPLTHLFLQASQQVAPAVVAVPAAATFHCHRPSQPRWLPVEAAIAVDTPWFGWNLKTPLNSTCIFVEDDVKRIFNISCLTVDIDISYSSWYAFVVSSQCRLELLVLRLETGSWVSGAGSWVSDGLSSSSFNQPRVDISNEVVKGSCSTAIYHPVLLLIGIVQLILIGFKTAA